MNYPSYILLIPLLPLAGFLLLGLAGKSRFRKSAGLIASLLMLVSCVLALYTAWEYFFINGRVDGVYQAIIPVKAVWLSFFPGMPSGVQASAAQASAGLSVDMGILLDPISVMMLVVVTFVSLMVHIFSLGYMKGEERFSTYYAFLLLFTFSMLGLVVASNLLETYIFWELVGLSSYLLIGFYYDRPAAVAAAKKAFIVTRFADLGFLVGILILAFQAGTLDFHTLIARLNRSDQFAGITAASFLGISGLTWALTLVFIGGAGKSAMFPLHIWLPDAMEGPTPVSALIHAATMVVAGVYLVARLFPVFSIDPAVLQIVTWVGAVSAAFAAIIACTQTDIKKVLAFSTMSQIGFMMFALGVSRQGGEEGLGYTASLFHLFTHAFFKSLLFLCAGAIIHTVHSNEMKDMGGLKKRMPLTHIAFLTGCLAISGIPPFSGFFSKEEILLAAWRSNPLIYDIGLIVSGITAFYMFRLYFSIFWNRPMGSSGEDSLHGEGLHGSHHGVRLRHHEGSVGMKFSLVVLSLGALAAGFIPFSRFIDSDGRPFDSHVEPLFSIVPVSMALAGILLAGWLYYRQSDRPKKLADRLGSGYRIVYKKFYIDEGYLFVTQKIIFPLVGRPAAWVDKHIVDGLMNGLARLVAKISVLVRGMQSGRLQNYMLYFFVGAVGLALFFVYYFNRFHS